jgi:hypothetical protein
MKVISLIRPIRKNKGQEELNSSSGLRVRSIELENFQSSWRMVKRMMKGFRWGIESETSENEVDMENKTRYQTQE